MKDSSAKSRFHRNEAPYDQISMGLVVDFNPATALCTVKLDKGGFVRNVPVLGMYGAQHGTDLSTAGNLRGAVVVLLKVYSQLYVLNTIPTQLNADFKVSEDSVTPGYGGSDTNTYGKGVDKSCVAMRSTDYITGDKIERAEGGAEYGLLKEGLAVLKASPLCQFTLNKLKDLGRLVTRVFQHFTDFGEVNMTHTTEGRVGLNVKGGADFINETHPSKSKWTVQTWVGDNPTGTPEDRLHVRVNDVGNSNFVTFTFNTNGEVFMETTGDKFLTVGKDHLIDITGDRKHTVGGSNIIDVTGDKKENIVGKKTVVVGGGETRVINGGKAETVNGFSRCQAGSVTTTCSEFRIYKK